MSNYLEHCKNITHLSSLNNIFTEHCKNITQACGLNYKYAYLHTQNCQKYYLSSLLYKLLYHCKKIYRSEWLKSYHYLHCKKILPEFVALLDGLVTFEQALLNLSFEHFSLKHQFLSLKI